MIGNYRKCLRYGLACAALLAASGAPLVAIAGDPATDYRSARTALDSGDAEQARDLFEQVLAAQPGNADAHLGLGLAYTALGEYARALIEFESVTRLDDLPPDLHGQVERYAQNARAQMRGQRLTGNSHLQLGGGRYTIHPTAGTTSKTSEPFLELEAGGGLNYRLDETYTLSGSADANRRINRDTHHKDTCRARASLLRSAGDDSLSYEVAGRKQTWTRGHFRNDYGANMHWRHRVDGDNQFGLRISASRFDYPGGAGMRHLSYDVAQLSTGWVHAFADGGASVSAFALAGRERATHQRVDGNANFYGLDLQLQVTLSERSSIWLAAWWRHNAFNLDRMEPGMDGDAVDMARRSDNLYELSGGYSLDLAHGWSLQPGVTYIKDSSNIAAINYESTELIVNLRKDF